jgi:hypothetical protein
MHTLPPLLPVRHFIRRQVRFLLYGLVIMGFSLGIGVVGYRITAHLSWLDSLLNASMILTGMGPVDAMQSVSSKLFASFYALYSGIVFLSSIAVLLAPVLHRVIHKLQLDSHRAKQEP